ncbi:MAG TPA: carboxypeptidase-like regulatory domain-containing protein, partial [Chryseolinea sp.]|nr:carboxypeptidase-like regulatory domain-containing protein [Chryseolinea sp.]
MINRLLKKGRRNITTLMVIVLQFYCSFLFAQSGSMVEGKVLEEDGAPLPGVNVIVKGTSIGTTTDAQGAFTVNVPDQQSVLVFSFIGYMTQEVTVGSQSTFE